MVPKRRAKRSKSSTVSLTPKQKEAFDVIKKELQCIVCKELLSQPQHLNCDHCVCKKCLKVLLQGDRKCPVCGAAFTSTEVQSDPIYSNLATKFKELSAKEGSEQEANNNISETSVSVFSLKQELKTHSPMSSPRKQPAEKSSSKRARPSPSKVMPLSDGRSVEIVNDSSNDAFTFLCTHPELQAKGGENVQSELPAKGGENVQSELPAKTEECEEKAPKSRKRNRAASVRQETGEDTAEFDISDYVIITSSLSLTAHDHIRQFAAQHHVLWMQEFPHQARLLDASCPQQHVATVEVKEDVGKRKKARQRGQRYIVVIRDKDGWCKRTVKYLYGLACGAWIVSMKWVEDNLASPQLIPPHAYELRGDTKTKVENAPRVSRIAHENGAPDLFNGIFFFIRIQDTKDGIPLNILIDLMQRCGCVRDMEDMKYRGRGMRIMEVVDRLTSKSDLNTVTVDWVLNCIGSWKLL